MKKTIFILLLAALFSTWMPSKAQSRYVEGQIIVSLMDTAYASTLQRLPEAARVTRLMPYVNPTLMLFCYDSGRYTLDGMLALLRSKPYVKSAAPDRTISLPDPVVETPQPSARFKMMEEPLGDNLSPNDSLFSQQWGVQAVRLPELWQVPLLPGARRPVIAIMDSGVDVTHPDLVDNIWVNEAERDGLPGVDDDGNGYVDDIHGCNCVKGNGDVSDSFGHGTHCAGIAAAVANNGIGIAGANPDALILPIKVESYSGNFSVSAMLKGLNYAVQAGADVISMSYSCEGYTETERLAYQRAGQFAILVASTGNASAGLSASPSYPAAYPSVIAVESSRPGGTLSDFSNYDEDSPWLSNASGENYELRAPGSDILSTCPQGRYVTWSGTSMAAPLVAGIISRLISIKEYASRDDLLRDLIISRGGNLGQIDAMVAFEGASKIGKTAMLQVVDTLGFSIAESKGTLSSLNVVNLSGHRLSNLRVTASLADGTSSSALLSLTNADQKIPALWADARQAVQCPDITFTHSDSLWLDSDVTAANLKLTLMAGDSVIDQRVMTVNMENDGLLDEGCYRIKFLITDKARHEASVFKYLVTDSIFTIPDSVSYKGRRYGLTSIGEGAFMDSRLSRLKMPSTIKTIGNTAFMNCVSLKQIDLPQAVSSLGHGTFQGCSSLEQVTIPEGVKALPAALFGGCTSLRYVDIPQSVDSIEKAVFQECPSLEKISIPKGVRYIPEGLFSGCTSLRSVSLPQSVKEIGAFAFNQCYSLEQVNLPAGLQVLNMYLFSECTSLQSIEIPASVEKLSIGAFDGCTALKKVTSHAPVPPCCDDDAFNGVALDSATLYVPAGSGSSYKAADTWSSFANIVELTSPTAILHQQYRREDGRSYDLQGRPANTSGKGIIIRSGRKYIK